MAGPIVQIDEALGAVIADDHVEASVTIQVAQCNRLDRVTT